MSTKMHVAKPFVKAVLCTVLAKTVAHNDSVQSLFCGGSVTGSFCSGVAGLKMESSEPEEQKNQIKQQESGENVFQELCNMFTSLSCCGSRKSGTDIRKLNRSYLEELQKISLPDWVEGMNEWIDDHDFFGNYRMSDCACDKGLRVPKFVKLNDSSVTENERSAVEAKNATLSVNGKLKPSILAEYEIRN
jgi:hypothetical protein